MNPGDSVGSGFGDVFILGAGFSKAISERMPLVQELSVAIASRLSGVINTQKVPFLSQDVELAMTYLSQHQPWVSEPQRLRNRALFLELADAIAAEINIRTTEVLTATIPAWLLRLVHWMHFRKAVVITLNYDTLLESAIAKIPGGNCYPRSLIPFLFAEDGAMGGGWRANSLELLKVHGSVNWRYSGRTSYGGELIHWAGLGDWRSQNSSGTSADKIGDTVPLIVPPVADKGSYFAHHSIQHLWRKASDALVSASRVFCVGYSLPAADLTMRFLLSDLNRPRPVHFYLVNLPPSVEHYDELLQKSQFWLDTRFVGADPVKSFVDSLFTEQFSQDYFGPPNETAGPVETAIRNHLGVGTRIPTALVEGCVVVDSITPMSITLRLDEAEIPLQLPWEAFEAVAVELARQFPLNIDELSKPLRPYYDRDLGPWMAALLEAAEVASTWYSYNRWVVSPAGTNLTEIAASRQAGHLPGR